MTIIEKLLLIARGFERERVTDAQAKSAVETILEAAREIARLTQKRERTGDENGRNRRT